MAIHPVNPDKVGTSVPQAKLANKSTVETKSQTLGSVASTDTVNITHGLSTAVDVDISTSEVDKTRVKNIRDALQSGSYKIDPERVADKMMRFDKKLPTDTT